MEKEKETKEVKGLQVNAEKIKIITEEGITVESDPVVNDSDGELSATFEISRPNSLIGSKEPNRIVAMYINELGKTSYKVKRERQPREKKEFKKEGTFVKRPRIDYEKDFEYIKEYVYGVLDNVCEMPENKEIGKAYLKDTINALTAIDPSRVYDWRTERYAIRHFAKKWVDDFTTNHGTEGLHEKVNGMFNWLVEYIYNDTSLFTSDVARSRPFDFVHVYIFPRLFLLAEVNGVDDDIRKWRILKKFVTNMMIFGNDRNFKEYYKIEMNK